MQSPAPNDDALLLLRSFESGVCTLTLNRPAARNALSTELMSALQRELDRVADDPEVRVVLMAASGPAFCAGHDLKQLRANPGQGTTSSSSASAAG